MICIVQIFPDKTSQNKTHNGNLITNFIQLFTSVYSKIRK